MAFTRTSIEDFALANLIYAGAEVSVWQADANGNKTATLATLYEAPMGTGTLLNPQPLDSEGKWKQPVYVEGAVIATVNASSGPHDTGLIQNHEAASFKTDSFTLVDGQADYTLSRAVYTDAGVRVAIDGADQEPTAAYTITGADKKTLRLVTTPTVGNGLAGKPMFAVHQASPSTLQVPGAGTVDADAITDDPVRLAETVTKLGDANATKASIEAASVPGSVSAIRTGGYTTPGDGGAALYKRVAAKPAHAGGIQSADGAWWAKVYDRATRPQRFETAGDDTVLREVVAAGGEYKAFPFMARTKTGRLVAAYWHGFAHSPGSPGGNMQGQFDTIYSDDGGASWSSPLAIYGNVTNGDPQWAYYLACGNDRHGNVVFLFGIYDGTNYVRPWITRSEDGVRWSDPVQLTITGTALDNGGTLIPFGTISVLPSGKMLVPVFQGNVNWAGIIDDDVSDTTLDLSSLIVNSSDPAYSEAAFCALSEKVWLAFLRRDGAVNGIPVFRTINGGATWAQIAGDAGLPVTGGYVVQAAFPFEIGGMTHIGLLTGIRKSASLPPTGSPGVLFAATSYKDLMESGDPQFRRRHVWPMADDGQIRDAYVGYVFDPVTCSLAIVTHEETGEFTSRILAGAVNVGSALNGQPEQVRRAWTPVLTGTSVVGTNTYTAQTGHYSVTGDWVDFYFRIDVSTLASVGNLQIEGWPFAFDDDQEMVIQTAFGLGAGIERLILRPTVNTTVAPILERSGASFFAHTEVSGTLVLRCTGRYRRYVEGA